MSDLYIASDPPSLFKKLTGWFSDVAPTVIGVLLFLWGEVFGIYHAFDKHHDGFAAVIIFPVAWYHSVEGLFWHDDFAGTNWDKKLASDMRIIIYLMNSTSQSDLKTNTDREQVLNEFSGNIHKYPADKLQILREGALQYRNYQLSVSKDFQDYVASFDIDTSGFQLSKGTDSLFEKLTRFDDLKATLAEGREAFLSEIRQLEKTTFSRETYDTSRTDEIVSAIQDAQKVSDRNTEVILSRLFPGF